ncbi:MAG: glycerol-3-phosphate 1-O-acyltransferase [Verrucomicrobiota bacterium]
MPYLSYLLTALVAYLLGSLPTGYLVARAKGIDIRTVGSGNIGATNAMRVLGKPVGIAVLLVDALKGYAAVAWLTPLIFNWLAPHFFGLYVPFAKSAVELQTKFTVLAAVCAVLGHNYTCWLNFKGGKGIATSAGVFLALAPLAIGVAIAVFAVAVLLTRYVSVGSIAAGVALPVAVWFTRESMLLRVVTIALGALAIYKHKTNIQRLAAGTENRLGSKPKESTK